MSKNRSKSNNAPTHVDVVTGQETPNDVNQFTADIFQQETDDVSQVNISPRGRHSDQGVKPPCDDVKIDTRGRYAGLSKKKPWYQAPGCMSVRFVLFLASSAVLCYAGFQIGELFDIGSPFWHVAYVIGSLLINGIAAVVLRWRVARRRRKSRLQLRADYVLQHDKRPPILLLRSFQDDASLEGKPSEIAKFKPRFFSKSFEEDVTGVLQKLGPVIAVSKPNERYAPLGASRLSLGEDWEDDVAKLIQVSCLIPLIVGATPGISREMRLIYELNCASKLLLMFPPEIAFSHSQRWGNFRQACEQIYQNKNLSLPSKIEPNTLFLEVLENWKLRPILCRDMTPRNCATTLYNYLHGRFGDLETSNKDQQKIRKTILQIVQKSVS